MPVVAPPPIPPATAMVGAWLVLKAFASGCTALTGVEAVSNGVRAFREPTSENAKKTLTVIIGLLIILLAGIAWLVKAYHIAATDPGAPGYQSVLSMLVAAVAGKGVFYYVTIASILLVLSLSANTAFADLPRLCRIIALDGYLPRSLANRGRRLVFSEGIYALTVLTGVLLVLFGGVTDRLIPLYAVGAFLAFTLSQLGMVFHWKRVRGPHALRYMFINGLGGFVTGITVLVVLVAKFVDGAWITMLLIPGLAAADVRRSSALPTRQRGSCGFHAARSNALSPGHGGGPARTLERGGQESGQVRLIHVAGRDRAARELRMDRAAEERVAGFR